MTRYSPTKPSGGRIHDEVSVIKEEFFDEMDSVRRPESRDIQTGAVNDVDERRRGKRQPTLELPATERRRRRKRVQWKWRGEEMVVLPFCC